MKAQVLVASNLRRLREQKKLTQSELAKKAGVSFRTIVYFESKKANPRINNLIKITTALDVEFLELFKEKRK